MSVTDRFFSKVIRKEPHECWPWIGSTDNRGYGRFYINGRVKQATQVSWQIQNGEQFPQNKEACHTCDNPNCVNPHHLFVGTHAENIRDALAKGKFHNIPGDRRGLKNKLKTHCIHGHEFTKENTRIKLSRGRDRRDCRECERIMDRERYPRRKK